MDARADSQLSTSPPTGRVLRSQQRLYATILSLTLGPVFMLGPLVGAGAFLWFAPWNIGIPASIGLVMVSGFFAYHMLQNFHWVEFDGKMLRGRKFWTRQFVEERLEHLTEVLTLHGSQSYGMSLDLLQTDIGEVLFCKGFEFRFQSGSRLAVVLGDMTNAVEFTQAVCESWKALERDQTGRVRDPNPTGRI